MAVRSRSSANDFYFPDLGEGLEEAELLEWCVHAGGRVAENDTIAKMGAAKALVQVPSPGAGALAGRDVEKAAGTGAANGAGKAVGSAETGPAPAAPAGQVRRQAAEVSSIRIPFRGVRRTIGEHLRYSVSHAIDYTVMDEVDVSEL